MMIQGFTNQKPTYIISSTNGRDKVGKIKLKGIFKMKELENMPNYI